MIRKLGNGGLWAVRQGALMPCTRSVRLRAPSALSVHVIVRSDSSLQASCSLGICRIDLFRVFFGMRW